MNTHIKYILVWSIAMLSLLTSSCAVDDTIGRTDPIGGYEEFYPVDTTPASNVTISAQTNSITMSFNMPVDQSTIPGNFALVQDINGLPTNLTQFMTLDLDATGSLLTFYINKELPSKADFTFSMNQAVRSLGTGKPLRMAINLKFNTGGGFQGDGNTASLPGKPYIIDENYIRECFVDANGQEIHTARIEVRFSEPLAFAPLIDYQVVNNFNNNWMERRPMTQLMGGDLTIMKVDVPSIGGLQGYKIRFLENYVRDWDNQFMDRHESRKMYQALVQCHPL